MSGKDIQVKDQGEGGRETRARRFSLTRSPFPLARRSERGFTLLELMIVISILVILALIAMSQYNKTVQAAREATLREDLYTLRKMIDQYAADKAKLPQSLDDLKGAGYIHEVPVDPFTELPDWRTDPGEDPGSTTGDSGVVNVHSNAEGTGSDGVPYNEW